MGDIVVIAHECAGHPATSGGGAHLLIQFLNVALRQRSHLELAFGRFAKFSRQRFEQQRRVTTHAMPIFDFDQRIGQCAYRGSGRFASRGCCVYRGRYDTTGQQRRPHHTAGADQKVTARKLELLHNFLLGML